MSSSSANKREIMDIFNLKAESKQTVGGPNARRMRHQGRVPAVVYGHGENVMCSIAEKDLKDLLITPKVYLIDLEIDGKVEHVILQDVQYHPVSDRPLHLDFYRFVEDEPITIGVPVVLQGYAKGVQAGGKLIPASRRLRVKGLAKDIPNFLPVDITKLNVGETLLVGQVSFENLEVVDAKTRAVCAIKAQRGAKAIVIEDEPEAEGEASEE